jgi:serine/threonine-protein kinase RsbW
VFERESLSVPAMRQVLGDTLRRIGVHEDSVADIVLAATEACTNVVLHAGGSAAAYEVAATIGSVGCRVEVTDSGQGWAAPRDDEVRADESRAEIDRGVLAESGRGFTVMRACVDDVTLRSAPGRGTSVVLDKRISWDG